MSPGSARIHITGASGSGTTTLGAAVARAMGARHFDVDDFLWLPSEPPFMQRRDPAARSDPGGSQYESNLTFMTLARGYESGEAPVNNLANARAWLSRLTCPVIEIDGAPPLEESLARVMSARG